MRVLSADAELPEYANSSPFCCDRNGVQYVKFHLLAQKSSEAPGPTIQASSWTPRLTAAPFVRSEGALAEKHPCAVA
jgi:hypothetical protein